MSVLKPDESPILDKKLNEVTVKELLEHLGLSADLQKQQRDIHQTMVAKAEESLANLDFLSGLNTIPLVLENAADAYTWYRTVAGLMSREYGTQEVVLVWAWRTKT